MISPLREPAKADLLRVTRPAAGIRAGIRKGAFCQSAAAARQQGSSRLREPGKDPYPSWYGPPSGAIRDFWPPIQEYNSGLRERDAWCRVSRAPSFFAGRVKAILAALANAAKASRLICLDISTLRAIVHGQGNMPPVAADFDERKIAAILTYVRNSWGNNYGIVTEEDVEAALAD